MKKDEELHRFGSEVSGMLGVRASPLPKPGEAVPSK
jgi:hypothetical protein